jgi:transposase
MRRRFVPPLSVKEQEEMTRTYRACTNADLVRRCHAILLSAEGHAIPTIAQLLRVDQSVIHRYRWLDRFEAGRLAALAPQERSGRPRAGTSRTRSPWSRWCATSA